MPRKRRTYTAEEKQYALSQLAANYGDVPITEKITGIPKRTLYDWKNEAQASLAQKTSLSPPWSAKGAPGKDGNPPDYDADHDYLRMRERLMYHVFVLLESLTSDSEITATYAMAVSRLIDRVLKLDALLPLHGNQTIRFEYRHPDMSLRPIPPWQTTADRPPGSVMSQGIKTTIGADNPTDEDDTPDDPHNPS